jgi:hypothetical protein
VVQAVDPENVGDERLCCGLTRTNSSFLHSEVLGQWECDDEWNDQRWQIGLFFVVLWEGKEEKEEKEKEKEEKDQINKSGSQATSQHQTALTATKKRNIKKHRKTKPCDQVTSSTTSEKATDATPEALGVVASSGTCTHARSLCTRSTIPFRDG